MAQKTLKLQEETEKKLLSEYCQKRAEQHAESEKQREKENIERRNEYRDFLLKQIDEKEKLKQKQKNNYREQPFPEELTNATEKHNLKLLKQQEERDALDICVKMKNNLKLEIKQKELEEDNLIAQFCKKRDNDTLLIQEKFKDKADKKEHRNNEVALMWTAHKDKDIKDKDLKREKVMDAMIAHEILDLGEECPSNFDEMRSKINIKRELLKETEERIAMLVENLEEGKILQHKLITEIADEQQQLEHELTEISRQKYGRNINRPQNFHQEYNGIQLKEVNSDHRKKKTLMEHN